MELKQLSAEMNGSSGISFLSDIEKGKRSISPPTVGKLIAALELDEGWIDRFLNPEEPNVDDEVTEQDRRIDQLLSAVDKEGDFGIAEGLLVTLAKEYAEGDTTDLNSAYKGLQVALQTARDMAARAALPDNTDAGMAAVRAEVLRLNAAADVEGAGAAIDDAIAQQKAGVIALLELGVQQDRLRNDPAAAAKRLVENIELQMPTNRFEAVRSTRVEWFERGRDQGIRFDLLVGIELARENRRLASTNNEMGTALNGIGITLQTLGEREGHAESLEEAVNVYYNAIDYRPRKLTPFHWAETHINLGNALKSLGELVGFRDLLLYAAEAFEDALLELTQDKHPQEWALTNSNLGLALQALGEREKDTENLKRAVVAHRNALSVMTFERHPIGWATAKNNLGNALSALAESGTGTTHFEEAIASYQDTLKVWTRERFPLDWALGKNNIGHVLIDIGTRNNDKLRLHQAICEFRKALLVRRRNRVPLDWAQTQYNLGTAYMYLGLQEQGTKALDKAARSYSRSLGERSYEGTPVLWAQTQHCLSNLEMQYFDKTGNHKHLTAAHKHALDAKAVYEAANAERDIAWINAVLADINSRRR